MKVKVYEYFGRHGIRTYTFLIGQDYISSIRIMGRKRVNLIKLFKKTKLEKRNLDNEFLIPGHLCSMLWTMKGDNRFEMRNKIVGWQILGPLGREKKKKDKF